MSQSKRITFASKELKDFKKQLEKDSVQSIERKLAYNAERAKDNVTKIYWPSEESYFLWSYGMDHSEFWFGIEEFCQMVYDLKSPPQMPPRPRQADHRKRRYLYFNILSRFYNSGELKLTFKEI
jgi:hypothetical protein